MLRGAAQAIVAVAATGAAGLALTSCGGSHEPRAEAPKNGAAVVSLASGGFSLTTFPGDSQAGLRFADFVTEGAVVVENQGDEKRPFALRQSIDFETPSGAERKASRQVGLRVVDATGSGPGREVYSGPVAGLREVGVGQIPAGESRRYEFKLTPTTTLRPLRLDLTYRWVAADSAPPRPKRTETEEKRAPEPPKPRLRVRLGIPPEQKVLDTRRIRVRVRCSRRCTVGAGASVRSGSRPPIDLQVTGGGPASPGRPAHLELRAGAKAYPVIRRALTQGPQVAVTLRVKARAGDGASARTSERIRLRPVPETERGTG